MLPLFPGQSRATRMVGAPCVVIAFGRHVARHNQKRSFERREKIAHFTKALNPGGARGWIRHFDRNKRAEQLEFALLELWLQDFGVGWEKTVGAELGAGIPRFCHFVEHLFVRLVPGGAGIIEDAPAVGGAGEQKTLVDAAHGFLCLWYEFYALFIRRN